MDTFLGRLKTSRKDPWVVIVKRDPCVYCGRMPQELEGGHGKKFRRGEATLMTCEHVIPKSVPEHLRPRGWQNLVGACWNCNHKRGDVPLLHYLLGLRARPVRVKRAPPMRKARPEVNAPPLRVPLGEPGSPLWFARLKIFGEQPTTKA
jgi:HNH endonuclease